MKRTSLRALTRIVCCAMFYSLAQFQCTLAEEHRITPRNTTANAFERIRILIRFDGQEKHFVISTNVRLSQVDRSLIPFCSDPFEIGGAQYVDSVYATHSLGEIHCKGEIIDATQFSEDEGCKVDGLLRLASLDFPCIGYQSCDKSFYLGCSRVRKFDRLYNIEEEDGYYYTDDIALSGVKDNFKIDLGLKWAMTLSPHTFQQLVERQIIANVHMTPTLITKLDSECRCGILAGAFCLGEQFNNIPVLEGTENSIGLSLLRKFDFRLNGDQEVIEVSDNADTLTPFFIDRSGMSLRCRNNDIVVGSVISNRPAANAGIQQGDIIIGYDGIQAVPACDAVLDLRERLSDPERDTIQFELLRDGDRMQQRIALEHFD